MQENYTIAIAYCDGKRSVLLRNVEKLVVFKEGMINQYGDGQRLVLWDEYGRLLFNEQVPGAKSMTIEEIMHDVESIGQISTTRDLLRALPLPIANEIMIYYTRY